MLLCNQEINVSGLARDLISLQSKTADKNNGNLGAVEFTGDEVKDGRIVFHD